MLNSAAGSRLANLWDDQKASGMNEAELLLYRSNLLGSDKRITNYGGGNTSAKAMEKDPLTGEVAEVLWVKGSGGDVGTIKMDGFATLYMDKLRALKGLYRGVDFEDEMVGYLPHCTFNLNPRAASIDTPLHAYVPKTHVDHMHPDAIIAIAAASDSKAITKEIFGDDIGWLPWVILGLLVLTDLALSFRRPKALDVETPAEIFVGESAKLRFRISGAPPGLSAKLDWPKGLTGGSAFSFDTGADASATAVVACRAVRRGVWHLEHLWLRWQSRLGLLEFVPRLTVGAEVRVIPNIRLVQSGQITTTVMSTLYGVKENRAIGEGIEQVVTAQVGKFERRIVIHRHWIRRGAAGEPEGQDKTQGKSAKSVVQRSHMLSCMCCESPGVLAELL